MGNELKPEQKSAVRKSAIIGKDLQLKYPKLLEMYREGKTIEEIASELKISSSYGVNERISITSVSHALRGYNGHFGGVSYGSLTDEKELDKLRDEHRLEGLAKGFEKGIKTMREEGSGIFGLTKKELSENGKRGGRKGGRTTLDKKLGIYSMTYEERQKVSHRVLISQGKLPWIKREETAEYIRLGELEFAYKLWQSSEYRHKNGKANGKPDWNLITREINEVYHKGLEIRTINTTKNSLNKAIREGKFI